MHTNIDQNDLPWVDTPYDTPPDIVEMIKQKVKDMLEGKTLDKAPCL